MRKVPEARAASKLLAALAALDVKRAARITDLLSGKEGKGKAPGAKSAAGVKPAASAETSKPATDSAKTAPKTAKAPEAPMSPAQVNKDSQKGN